MLRESTHGSTANASTGLYHLGLSGAVYECKRVGKGGRRVVRCWQAALFRMGMLLGFAPSGDGQLSSTLPDGVYDGGFIANTNSEHAKGAPLVATCPLVAVGSDTDLVWPGNLVERWKDVAASGYIGRTLKGVEHIKVRAIRLI